jgi:hypothetical protein
VAAPPSRSGQMVPWDGGVGVEVLGHGREGK